MLYGYQQEIVDNQYEDAKALFMDMGTGKTFVSMGMFSKSKASRLLVICLATKVEEWRHTIEEYLGLSVSTPNSKKPPDQECVIVSFEMSWRLGDKLLSWVGSDTHIIIDESHKIKNSTSKVGRFAIKLGRKTAFKTILTGTPQSKGYIDYFAQFKFLGYLDMTLTQFKSMFCIEESMNVATHSFKQIVGYKNTHILDDMIQKHSVFFKRDVEVEEIPSESDVRFPMYAKYKKIKNDRVYDFGEDFGVEIYDSMGAMVQLERRLASGYNSVGGEVRLLNNAKIKWLEDFLESVGDNRVVIFYNYNAELYLIREVLDRVGRTYSEYNGRSRDLRDFKSDSGGIALVQYLSGSTGINDLVDAHILVMFSLPKSYIDFEQAKKRIDRLGQTKKPMFYYLIMNGSIDSSIYKNLKEGKDFDDRTYGLSNYGKTQALQ